MDIKIEQPVVSTGVIPAAITDPTQAALMATNYIGPRFGSVTLAPLGTGADDVRVAAVYAACKAAGYPLWLMPGAYNFAASSVITARKASEVGYYVLPAAVGAITLTESIELIDIAITTYHPQGWTGLADWWECDPVEFPWYADITGGAATLLRSLTNNGHDLTDAASAPKRPAQIVGGAPSGKDLLHFNGTANQLTAAFACAQPSHWFLAVKWKVGAGVTYLVNGTALGSSIYLPATTTATMNAGSDGPTITIVDNVGMVLDGVFSGAASKLGINGGTQVTGSAGTNSPGGVMLGSACDFDYSQFDFYAAMRFSVAQTGTNRARVVAYLRGKSGW